MSEPLSREALIAEIQEARRRLGEPPLGADAGVSGRNVDAIVDLAGKLGLEAAELQEDLDFDLQRARRAQAWIPWSSFNALLERIRALAGDEGTRRLGALALESPLFRAVGIAAGAFVSEQALFAWVTRFVWRPDGLYFRGIDARLDTLGARDMRVSWRGREHVKLSRAFALAMTGIAAELPRLVGAPPAEITLEADGPDEVVVQVRLAERRRGRIARILRDLGSRRASDELRALYTELVETNQLLQEKLEAIEASRAARRELELKLEQRRRMEMLGRFAATIRHDFNNLLTVILNHAGFIALSLEDDDPRREDVEVVVNMAERAAQLARQLRGFDLRDRRPEVPIDLRAMLTGAQRMLDEVAGGAVEVISRRCAEPATVRVEPTRAEQVLSNLVINAREAMPDGGRVEVAIRVTDVDEAFARQRPPLEPGPHVVLSVSDEGRGIPSEARQRIFEPFFTTKDGGHGVGLATVYAVVTAAGGAIDVSSREGEGTRFDVWWPRVDPPPRSAPPPAPSAAPTEPPRGRSALVIEDHPQIRAATERILTGAGFSVTSAGSGGEALELVEAGLRPEVVVSDVVMPGIRGAALARALREQLGPPLPILFVSGYAERALDEALGPRTDFLPKPYRPSELVERVTQLLARD